MAVHGGGLHQRGDDAPVGGFDCSGSVPLVLGTLAKLVLVIWAVWGWLVRCVAGRQLAGRWLHKGLRAVLAHLRLASPD